MGVNNHLSCCFADIFNQEIQRIIVDILTYRILIWKCQKLILLFSIKSDLTCLNAVKEANLNASFV